jgi:hypothetical protein
MTASAGLVHTTMRLRPSSLPYSRRPSNNACPRLLQSRRSKHHINPRKRLRARDLQRASQRPRFRSARYRDPSGPFRTLLHRRAYRTPAGTKTPRAPKGSWPRAALPLSRTPAGTKRSRAPKGPWPRAALPFHPEGAAVASLIRAKSLPGSAP